MESAGGSLLSHGLCPAGTCCECWVRPSTRQQVPLRDPLWGPAASEGRACPWAGSQALPPLRLSCVQVFAVYAHGQAWWPALATATVPGTGGAGLIHPGACTWQGQKLSLAPEEL